MRQPRQHSEDAELQSERQAHQICVEMRNEAEAEIARLQDAVFHLESHLKAVRRTIEESWHRVQAALSGNTQQRGD